MAAITNIEHNDTNLHIVLHVGLLYKFYSNSVSVCSSALLKTACRICRKLIKKFYSLSINAKIMRRVKKIGNIKKLLLPVGELNPGLPRDRRGYSPLY